MGVTRDIVGKVFQHYKNKQQYKVLAVGKHVDTQEKLVTYKSLYPPGDIWVRPYNTFIGIVSPAPPEGEILNYYQSVIYGLQAPLTILAFIRNAKGVPRDKLWEFLGFPDKSLWDTYEEDYALFLTLMHEAFQKARLPRFKEVK